MEIKNLNNRMINAYKSVAVNPVKNGKDSTPKTAGTAKADGNNFDKIEFDFPRSINAAKTDIVNTVSAEAGAERIESLQANYKSGELPVTPEQIAETIVG
ncbi:MAG: hypothetical protein FWG44_05120 [Oscillospiraceae bacterium]|nr:hypothetical protein [Oscillospiraceae bacterium]